MTARCVSDLLLTVFFRMACNCTNSRSLGYSTKAYALAENKNETEQKQTNF